MTQKIILTAIFSLIMTVAMAQVTIGSGEAAVEGALLDIKSQEGTSANSFVTATKGLILPRVQLTSNTSLLPLSSTTDETLKRKHAGATVYNLSTTNGFSEGVYIWDGTQWHTVAGGGSGTAAQRWFYLPSFNLPVTSTGTNQIYDLYTNVYKKQFTKSGNSNFVTSNTSSSTPTNTVPSPTNGTLYTATQLEYIVTDYTGKGSLITIKSISTAGVMTYDVHSTDIPEDAYINIVLVVKE